MSEELKVCPFCGEPPDVGFYETESLFSHDVVQCINISCGECDCARVSGEQHDEVRAAWNRRAASPAMYEALKEIAELPELSRPADSRADDFDRGARAARLEAAEIARKALASADGGAR